MSEYIKPKEETEIKHHGDIFIVRIVVCVIILLGTLFVRFNNRYIYDSLKFWYQENVLEEKYSFEDIKENIENLYFPVKNKVLSFISDLKSANK